MRAWKVSKFKASCTLWDSQTHKKHRPALLALIIDTHQAHIHTDTHTHIHTLQAGTHTQSHTAPNKRLCARFFDFFGLLLPSVTGQEPSLMAKLLLLLLLLRLPLAGATTIIVTIKKPLGVISLRITQTKNQNRKRKKGKHCTAFPARTQ